MTVLQKFLFDTDFGALPPPSLPKLLDNDNSMLLAEKEVTNEYIEKNAEEIIAEDVEETETTEKMEEVGDSSTNQQIFSEEELAVIRKQAFEEGCQEGIRQASEDMNKISSVMNKLLVSVQLLLSNQEKTNKQTLNDAISVAVAIMRKLAPEWSKRYGTVEIEAIMGKCLTVLSSEVKVVIRSSHDDIKTIREKVGEISAMSGFDGKIICMEDALMPTGDCRIEWSNGGTELNLARILTEIDGIVDMFFSSLPPAGNQETGNELAVQTS